MVERICIYCAIALLSMLIFLHFRKKWIENQQIIKSKENLNDLIIQENELKHQIYLLENENIQKQIKRDEIKKEINSNQSMLSVLKDKIQSTEEDYRVMRQNGQKIIDQNLKAYEELNTDKVNKKIDQLYLDEMNKFEEFLSNISEMETDYTNQINEIKNELEDFRKKRESINETIRKENQIDNEQHGQIKLSELNKLDIEFLLSIENKLSNKEILRKLIWSEYLIKPFNQMINDQFGAKVPKNVIYCIENIDTKQKYIGKTKSSVKDRWTDHIKSSLGIATISHQKIHNALLNNWDKFIFTIIEVVDENINLTEREKYYINLFQSDKYGYNIVGGN